MPTVTRLNIAPVKGLALESRTEIQLEASGVLEDRRFYFVDPTGRLVDGLTAGPLVRVAAWTDPDASALRMTLPDGQIVEGEVRLAEPIETPIYGRTAVGHVVDGPWASALEPLAGRPLRLVRVDEPGRTRAEHPATLLGDGSLDMLAQQLGVPAVDPRRFRMLIELTGAAAHEEDTWCGRRVAIGSAVLAISKPVPRCAITTQDPDTGVRDLDTLRTIIAYRGLRDGKDIDFGVWGEVERPGSIRLGDEVRLLD